MEWENLLANRGEKKIILYHTSIAMAEKDQNGYLEYVQGTLEAFYKRKDEVMLLWYSTTGLLEKENGITEEFLDAYNQMIAQYREANWGIFAEENDWDFAKEVADIYYGEDVAKAMIFTAEGKEAVIAQLKTQLFLEALLPDGDYLWAFLSTYPDRLGVGLFKIRKSDWELEYIGSPNRNVLRPICFIKILKKDQKLYLIPCSADFLAIYDIEHDTWENITITDPECNIGFLSKYKFSTGEFYENYLYLFSIYNPVIARYDICKGQFEYLYECTKHIKILGKLEKSYFSYKSFSDGRYVTFYCRISKKILCFDMKENKMTCLLDHTPYFIYEYDLMEYDGQNCWLFTGKQGGSFLKYDTIIKKVSIIKNRKEINSVNNEDYSFLDSCMVGEFVWILPRILNKSLKINIMTNDVEYALNFDYHQGRGNQYYLLEKIEDILYTYEYENGIFIGYDLTTKTRKTSALIFCGKEKASWSVEKTIDYFIHSYFDMQDEFLRNSLGIVQKLNVINGSGCGKQVWAICK